MHIGGIGWLGMPSWNMHFNTYQNPAVSSPSRITVDPAERRAQLRAVREQVSELRDALGRVSSTWHRPRSASFQPASTSSAVDLGLGAATSAYLESTEEVNATPTSFTPFGPEWSGSSTAELTIDGEYDGSNGTGTLTFEVNKEGIHGEDDVKIRVYEPDGHRLQTVNVKKEHPIDQEYVLDNGLIFTLGEGALIKNETLTLEVYDAIGSEVDPDGSFDGIRNENPNLQYGYDITAGSFTVNGETINVATDDTINSVVDRINQSAAGVTASYSALTELVSLVHDTPGPAGSVALANDTSGFLAATKLSGAALNSGRDAEADQLMADVPRFASVSAGSIVVNGETIGIGPGLDSLQDVLDRITASSADVTASVDLTGRFVSFVANDPTEPLTLDDNGTGFFPAVEITAGTFEPTGTVESWRGMTRHHAIRIAKEMKKAADALNELFAPPATGESEDYLLAKIREQLTGAMKTAFDSDEDRLNSKLGILIDFGDREDGVFSLSSHDRQRLVGALMKRPASVESLFFAKRGNSATGMVNGLLAELDAVDDQLAWALESTGQYVDTYA